MTGPNRDWDKEMAEIDKIIAKSPAVPSSKPTQGGGGGGGAPAKGEGAPVARTRRTLLTGWARVLLGVVVAAGVTQWPYAHACGLALYFYLGALGGVVLAGLWGAVTSWSRRMGWAHIVSLLVALWGGALLGKAVLDRTAYAKQPLSWTC
ncbi:MAG: hypothetical protein HOP28_12685 [Gemmatimonadales bacterium]|nr:hypothetical protein [Gemmatimonadales bacterium]